MIDNARRATSTGNALAPLVQTPRWARRIAARRSPGIILLIVLVLLALFTMLLISFVVATVSNRQSVIISARAEQTGDPPAAQLNSAFMQVVRGSQNTGSVMGAHSLLEDMYGHNVGAPSTASQLVQGVRGKVLPSPFDATRIGYCTFRDKSNASLPYIPVPYLPTFVAQDPMAGNLMPPQDVSLPADHSPPTAHPHTPFLAFTASITGDLQFPNTADTTTKELPPYGFYNGRLITMLTGPAAGRTGRIVGYYFNQNNRFNYLQVYGFEGITPDPGDEFLINGRPFSGTGFGFRPNSFMNDHTRLLDAIDPSGPAEQHLTQRPDYQPGLQYALLPNHRRGIFNPRIQGPSTTLYIDPAGPGGANEDYDAPDFQNMLMAMRLWGTPTMYPTMVGFTAPPPVQLPFQMVTPLPSLHRPDLLAYWNSRWQTQPLSAQSLPHDLLSEAQSTNPAIAIPAQTLLRKVVLRPLPTDHPNFTGGNPYLDFNNKQRSPFDPNQHAPAPLLNPQAPLSALIYGPWDVDNDGDGTPDSIWVDLGFPVQTTPDGRRYKPLFAILCLDMDGKLNLNAHSNVRHIPPYGGSAPSRFASVNAPFTIATSAPLRVGSGLGPPEISLHPLFEPGSVTAPNGELQNLLSGLTRANPGQSLYSLPSSEWVEGRYGELELGAKKGIATNPGITFVDDPINWMRELNLPQIRNWGTWSQRQLPAMPVNYQTSLPYITNLTSIDTTRWSGGRWLQWKGSNYGSLPDVDGDGMIGLDLRGQPMYIDYPSTVNVSMAGDAGWGEPDECIDDPYEIDLSLTAQNDGYSANSVYSGNFPNGLAAGEVVSVDAPFTAAELERILRSRDGDIASLPDRIIRLAPLAFTSSDPLSASNGISGRAPYFPEIAQMTNLVTTHSFDLPVPSMTFTSPDQAYTLRNTRSNAALNSMPPMANSHIAQLLAARISNETGIANFNADFSISQMVAPELIGGEKMNINRPLGNGFDDNNNGVIDEPGEVEYGWAAVTGGNPTLTPGPGNGVAFDLNNDGGLNNQSPPLPADGNNPAGGSWADSNGDGFVDNLDGANGTLARQMLARHLYVLMMLLADRNPAPITPPKTTRDTFLIQGKAQEDANGNGKTGPTDDPTDMAYYFAQWAVNVVDFLDGDSIMTPFEFDIYPFQDNDTSIAGTWDVDGVVASENQFSSNPNLDDSKDYLVNGGTSYRGLVWGCERPELLITETIATHDRRSADTNQDTTGKAVDRDPMSPKDDDFDQVRRPQGSLIVELFNPNSPFTVGTTIAGQNPSELYTQAANDTVTGAIQFGVNLRQFSANGSPVWRLATQKLGEAVPLQAARAPTLPANKVDRVVYFIPYTDIAANSLTMSTDGYRQFYSSYNGEFAVPSNGYALVGPAVADLYTNSNVTLPNSMPSTAPVIHLGVRDRTADKDASNLPINTSNPITQQIKSIENRYYRSIYFPTTASTTAGSVIWNTSGASGVAPYDDLTNIKRVIGFPVDNIPLGPAGVPDYTKALKDANRSLRMSISEPDGGYEVWGSTAVVNNAAVLGGTGNVGNDNAYYDTDPSKQKIPDQPYDEDAVNFQRNLPNSSDALRQALIVNGTSSDTTSTASAAAGVTVVYLQRLANPLRKWDARANPYIIVDQMPVDLTSYNSEKSLSPGGNKEEFAGMGTTSTWKFDTRRRSNSSNSTKNPNNIWSQDHISPAGVAASGTSVSNLVTTTNNTIGTTNPPMPNSTLGYLNNEYGNYPTNRYLASNASVPTGFPAAAYRGDPTIPFPWLNWNNRPFVSAKELMLVPLGSPSSLLSEVTSGTTGGTTWPSMAPLSQQAFEQGSGSIPTTAPLGEYGHLPAMFHSPHFLAAASGATLALPRQEYSPNFYRLLEYVQVPSRFAGTEEWLPPNAFTGNYKDEQNGGTNNPSGLPMHLFHPPFNRISRLRDPGRVNINTIFDPFVFQGIVDDQQTALQGAGPPWRNLWRTICETRLGTTLLDSGGNKINTLETAVNSYMRVDLPAMMTSTTSGNHAAPILPTIVGAPFRSYAGRTLVPLDIMRREMMNPLPTVSPPPAPLPSNYPPEREVDATLMRVSPYSNSGTSGYPLLEYPGPTVPSLPPATWQETTPAINDAYRNPYFAYKAYRRLDNLLTTRSNVYAVWITVGYFEVSPAPSNDPLRAVKYPDGWVLGQELGADTGDIERHRSFYMYDRTIPVGFERGENHNVHRGILLERFIE